MNQKNIKRVSVPSLVKMKRKNQRITMLTAYDASFARLLDEEVEILLVGDSLGMVFQGHEDTLAVTVEEMIYHTKVVARVSRHAQIVSDMPFLSYQASIEEGVRNAGRMLKEGNAHAVKIEGFHPELIKRLTSIGIPVMGHLGLLPQSVHAIGGYKVQGKAEGDAERMLAQAKALQEVGIYSLVLEAIPLEIAKTITEELDVPTIGIGAGVHCDGQVLVINDLLGFDESFNPRFLKKYQNFGALIKEAVRAYTSDVREAAFPTEEHSFSLKRKEKKNSESKVYGG